MLGYGLVGCRVTVLSGDSKRDNGQALARYYTRVLFGFTSENFPTYLCCTSERSDAGAPPSPRVTLPFPPCALGV